jgi:hypothetical protein
MRKAGIILIGIALTLIVCTCGCFTETTEEEPGTETGTLQLKITDKPKDDLEILHANVTISMVQVHTAAVNITEDEDIDENADGLLADAHGDYQGIIGENIEFQGTASGGIAPYNWTWNFGDGNISYLQNPIHNYSANGTYVVNLTVHDNDSAIDYDTARVIIGDAPNDITPDAGWHVIINESQKFDLIALQNASTLLGEHTLSTGKYTQIRLSVDEAEIEVNESGNVTTYSLEIPSHVVKLIHPFTIVENEMTVLTLDFDIHESIHQAGSKFLMRPTITIIEE